MDKPNVVDPICSKCGGSGGGPDPATTCPECGGSGRQKPTSGELLARRFRAESRAGDGKPEGTRESLERCARMLDTYAPECFPASDNGQIDFARAMMESVADEIRAFLKPEKTMSVRAKVRCTSNLNGSVTFTTVYEPDAAKDTENARFTKATPWGDIRLGIDNPAALEQFKPNEEYYVDFTPTGK